MNEQKIEDPSLTHLDTLATWLDNRFRIPYTNIRFGFDGLIGLAPYLGDVVGLAVSGMLMRVMFRHGASPVVMLQMMGNVAVDAIIGVVPIAGDIFDFGYKANRRNVNLLKKYYADDRVKPNAKKSLALLGILFFAVFALLIWGIWKLSAMFIT